MTRPTPKRSAPLSRWKRAVAQLPRGDGRAAALAVGLALESFASRDGVAWPSGAALVEASGLGLRTVRRGIAVLKLADLIEEIGRRGRTRQVIVWHLRVPAEDQLELGIDPLTVPGAGTLTPFRKGAGDGPERVPEAGREGCRPPAHGSPREAPKEASPPRSARGSGGETPEPDLPTAKAKPTTHPPEWSQADFDYLHGWRDDPVSKVSPAVRSLTDAEIDDLAETCLDHFRGTGKPKTTWRAVARNWIKRDAARTLADRRRNGGPASVSTAAQEVDDLVSLDELGGSDPLERARNVTPTGPTATPQQRRIT